MLSVEKLGCEIPDREILVRQVKVKNFKNVTPKILEWLRELEELACATRNFRSRTFPLLPKEKQLVSDSPTH